METFDFSVGLGSSWSGFLHGGVGGVAGPVP